VLFILDLALLLADHLLVLGKRGPMRLMLLLVQQDQMLLQGDQLAPVQLLSKMDPLRVELFLSLRMLPLIPPHQELYMEQTMYLIKKVLAFNLHMHRYLYN